MKQNYIIYKTDGGGKTLRFDNLYDYLVCMDELERNRRIIIESYANTTEHREYCDKLNNLSDPIRFSENKAYVQCMEQVEQLNKRFMV